MNSKFKTLLAGVVLTGALFVSNGQVEAASIEGNQLTIEKGDTLYKLQKNLDINIKDLKKVNNMKNDTIKVGQVLTLPKKEVKGEVKVTGMADSHTIEVFHVESQMYYALQVDAKQMKKLKNKKKLSSFILKQGTNKLLSWK